MRFEVGKEKLVKKFEVDTFFVNPRGGDRGRGNPNVGVVYLTEIKN